MARVDALLARLEKMGGESVMLASNKPAQLVVGGKPTPLAPVLTDENVASLLAEVMPESERAGYEENGFAEFSHRARTGQQTSVIAEKSGKGIVVRPRVPCLQRAAHRQGLREARRRRVRAP